MILKLYKVSKIENSTKQPTGTPYQVTANLKDETDILHPVFELMDYNFSSDYNYVKVSIYGKDRYYFVNKIVYRTKKTIYMYCDVDVLATWKDYITGSSQFVTRCSDPLIYINVNYESEYLIDSSNPATIKSTTTCVDSWDVLDRAGGYYVLGLNVKKVDHPLAVRGSVSYVVMNRTDLNVFKSDLFTLTGTMGDLAPIQYIVSCVYIPLTYVDSQFNFHQSEAIDLGGNYTMNISYREFKMPMTSVGLRWIERDVSLGVHPQANSMGYFLNYEPYRKMHLVASVFGDFDLPISIMEDAIRYHITIDLTDGSAVLEITNQWTVQIPKIIYLRLPGQVGTPISLAQIVTNTVMDAYKVGSHIATSFGSAVNINFGQSIAEMGSAIMSAYEGNLPKLSTSGSNGSLASIGTIDTNMEYVTINDDDLTHVGKPIFRNVALNTVTSGSFVMIRNAIAEIDGLFDEQKELIAKMESGFYLD